MITRLIFLPLRLAATVSAALAVLALAQGKLGICVADSVCAVAGFGVLRLAGRRS